MSDARPGAGTGARTGARSGAEDPVRFGVLGAARITPNALVEPAGLVPGVRLVAVAARDRERAEAFAKERHVETVLEDYEAVVRSDDVDAIYNPLPAALHCEWSIRALEAGKHVLCEKPLAANASEARRMADAARAAGRILVEAFHWRYHPLAERMRGVVRGGAIGQIEHIEGAFSVPFHSQDDIRFVYELGGGALMDLGCYPLQWIRFLGPSEPEVVRASAICGPPQVDVELEAELRFETGATASLSCSMQEGAPLGATLRVRGSEGELRVTNPLAPHIGNEIRVENAGGVSTESVVGDSTYTHQLRAFVAWLRGGPPMPTDGEDGVRNMALIDEIYRKSGLQPRGT